jgi:hypothetical protein
MEDAVAALVLDPEVIAERDQLLANQVLGHDPGVVLYAASTNASRASKSSASM